MGRAASIAIAALALTLMTAGAVQAAPLDYRGHGTRPLPTDIRDPDWERLPTGGEMSSLYPDTTDQLMQGGAAAVRCRISASATLYGCVVLYERPPNEGLGRMVLYWTRYFKLKPIQKDCRPAAGRTVVVPFRLKV